MYLGGNDVVSCNWIDSVPELPDAESLLHRYGISGWRQSRMIKAAPAAAVADE